MKWIVIEGADGTGKSTLARRIIAHSILSAKEILTFNYRYPEEMSKDMNLAYARGEYEASIRIFKKLLTRRVNIICDRFHLGEFTYGQVKRGYNYIEAYETLSRIDWQIMKQFRWDYLKNHFSLILLGGEASEIIRRASGAKQYPRPNELRKILELYEQVYHLSLLPKIWIDTSESDMEDTTEKALDFIFRKERP